MFWKKQAEAYLLASGIHYTMVRPGSLKDNFDNSESILMASQDTLFEDSISRHKVAQVCVEAISYPEAKSKIIEVITSTKTEAKTWLSLLQDTP